jgi:hypothetical protein
MITGKTKISPDDENIAFQSWQKVPLPSKGRAGERS